MRVDEDVDRKLAEDFPGWYFWRARSGVCTPASWMATRVDRNAGVSPTLMAPSEPALREQLAQESAKAVRSGRAPILAGPTF